MSTSFAGTVLRSVPCTGVKRQAATVIADKIRRISRYAHAFVAEALCRPGRRESGSGCRANAPRGGSERRILPPPSPPLSVKQGKLGWRYDPSPSHVSKHTNTG